MSPSGRTGERPAPPAPRSNHPLIPDPYNGFIKIEKTDFLNFLIQKPKEKDAMKKINTYTGDLIAFAVLVVGLVGTIAIA
jgi:hypothetical protein